MSVSLSSDKTVREAYGADASGLRLVPELVARPDSIEEVSELLRRATADRTPVTCAGAQTSTTAASITDKGVLLSLRSLDRIWEVDEKARIERRFRIAVGLDKYWHARVVKQIRDIL